MQEVMPNIYIFSVPLPHSPLKEINTYVIKTPDRNVLFDTAYNMPQCQEALIRGLTELDLKISDLDLVITHLHADHTGLTHLFADAGCRIYASPVDGNYANTMATGEYWQLMASFHDLYGMQEGELDIVDNPGFRYKLAHAFDFIPLNVGDDFIVGDYHFSVQDLIGHTPGHIGLYEADQEIIFSGDTVLDPMTPNITYWGSSYPNILGSYLQTLQRLQTLPLKQMFATHRQIINKPSQRIQQLIGHHFDRLKEILDAMEEGRKYTIRDLSARISWRIKADNWEDFPKSQKWFAAGETMAHADYLVHSNCLKKTELAGCLYFEKVQSKLKFNDLA